MARKLGDIGLALIILAFVVGGISFFLLAADKSASVSSGIVSEQFETLSGDLETDVEDLQVDVAQKIDNTSTFVPETDIDVDQRGDETFGILNILGKNVLTRFTNAVSEKVPGASTVFALITALAGLTTTILLLRAWRGEGKI